MSYSPFDYPKTTAVGGNKIRPCAPTGDTIDPATTEFEHTDGTSTSERAMEEGSAE